MAAIILFLIRTEVFYSIHYNINDEFPEWVLFKVLQVSDRRTCSF